MLTTIEPGQEFYDEPVLAWPKVEPLEGVVARAVRPDIVIGWAPGPNALALPILITKPNYVPLQPITVRHERVRLNWLKPDGTGGLIPRNQPAAVKDRAP